MEQVTLLPNTQRQKKQELKESDLNTVRNVTKDYLFSLMVELKVKKGDSEWEEFCKIVLNAGIPLVIFKRNLRPYKGQPFGSLWLIEDSGLLGNCIQEKELYLDTIYEMAELNHWYENEYCYFMDKNREERERYLKISAMYYQMIKKGKAHEIASRIKDQDLREFEDLKVDVDKYETNYKLAYDQFVNRMAFLEQQLKRLLS